MGRSRVLYWFRTDLRLHDSPALKAALDLNPEAFWPIWTWDPYYVYRSRVGINRWQFLIDCQNELSRRITQINKKSKLFVIREAPQTVLPKLFKAWKITHLVFEKDVDAYGKERDAAITQAAEAAGVKVLICHGRTLWDSDELVKKNKNQPTMTISQVQAAGPKVGKIPRPLPAPTQIPNPGDLTLPFEHQKPEPIPDLCDSLRESSDRSFGNISGPQGDFAVPTMRELGFPVATTPHRGGEHVALKMLDEIIANEHYTATFEKPNTAPTAFEPQSTTLLSPHLHFGSLGIREFYWRVQDVVNKFGGKASKPPVSLIGQLLFRDMYFGAQAALSHSFNQTVFNSHCRFIPWHLQSKFDPETKRVTGEYHVDSLQAEEWFQRWKCGRTGFPWIDALMRQLRQEGWIHHLGRHAVACFLTRGGCYISWERGAEVFKEWLLDHEPACNAGNWQWLSCTAFFTQFFRCYSPIAFPQKYDKNGDFVRRYVPELKMLDKKYIYEPWKAPLPDLKKAGLKLQDNWDDLAEGAYVKPMFDFNEQRNICMEGMKKAYKIGLYGDNPCVIDGTWENLFGSGGGGKKEEGALKEDECDGERLKDKSKVESKDKKITNVARKKRAQTTLENHLNHKKSKISDHK
ncbi:Cryptochrome/photolyase FAD-binding domain-containing protein [Erysiphe pulchra]|uniref:Cryptochrome/photolyase FAD-binding domain-containing protein n=1 Tax=Erysiphe pulchra TaxID=225359 RepID=A0A2S4PU00_9PEZI|nr:Cryptochrome/photolyase FAD-binding domain-containing protein [Erysiphe pulchra]